MKAVEEHPVPVSFDNFIGTLIEGGFRDWTPARLSVIPPKGVRK
jgi:hypothetical protein